MASSPPRAAANRDGRKTRPLATAVDTNAGESFDDWAAVCAALGQTTRLRLLSLLAEQTSHTPSQMASALGVAMSTLSFHLRDLEQAGLITTVRDGRQRHYRLNHQRAEELVRFLMARFFGAAQLRFRVVRQAGVKETDSNDKNRKN